MDNSIVGFFRFVPHQNSFYCSNNSRITTRVANTPAPTPRDLAPTATAGSPKTTEVVETLFLVALAEEEEVEAAVDMVAVEEAAEDEEGGKGFYLPPWISRRAIYRLASYVSINRSIQYPKGKWRNSKWLSGKSTC